MPVGINSPARNLFLLGSSGQAAVTNFFETIDQSAGTDGVYLPAEIKYIFSNQKYALAGSAQDSNAVSFGWFERQDYDIETGVLTTDYTNEVVNTQSLSTTLFAMELDANENLIVGGKTGDVPWIAKYSNDGVLDWQSTTNSADVEYSGIASNSSGNYYACGSTQSPNPQQAFVEKFDANGNPGWGKSAFMLGRHVMLDAIDANSRGQVVAVGHLEDDSSFKGYIVKLDTNTGEVLWDRTLDVGDGITLSDVFIDSNDQIYIVGTSLGAAVEGYIFKYTAEGNLIWQRKTNGSSLDNFTFDRVKSDGETEQTIVFGTYYDVNGNDLGGVLSKYAKDGSLVWRRTIFSSNNNSDSFSDVCLDADPSFYYLLYVDTEVDGLAGTPDAYTFGKVSSSGNGLGGFQYADGTGETIDYQILNIGDTISRVSDGAVRNDSSDLITYPFTGNKIVFDDLSTHVTNKKRQMDDADSFEYSGSPAIRPADFQELNLLGDVYSGSGDWLDQSGKGNHAQVSDQEPFPGTGAIILKDAAADFYEVPYSDEFILGTEWTIEFYIKARTNRDSKLIGTRGDSAPNGWEIVYKLGQIGIEQYGDETTSGQQRTSEVLPVGTWTHVAVVNYNGGVKIYYDGVDTGFNWTGSSGSTWPAGGSHPLRIGKPTSYNEGPNVLMSNIRIVTGSAIYTSGFNPPSLPLSNTGQTTTTTGGTDYYTGSEWSPGGINNPEEAFTTAVTGSGSNGGSFGPFTYTFATPVTGVTSARIRGSLGASTSQVGGTTNCILVDGTDVTQKFKNANGFAGSNVWVDVTAEVGSTWNTFRVQGVSGSTNPNVSGIEVNGVQLLSQTSTTTTTGTVLLTAQGTTMTDASDSNHTITTGGNAAIGSEFFSATYNSSGYWEFDGVDDEIDFGNQASIITSGSFTVEAWAWRDTITAENGLFDIEDTNQGVILLSAGNNGGNDYRFLVRKGSYGAGPVQANVEAAIAGHGLNEWHHYLGTYNDDTGTIVMYVDGVQVDTDTNASIIGVNFSGTLDSGIHIGPSAGRGRWHDGRIGEVRIYPRALTAAQVFQNYNATKSKYINEAPDTAPKISPGISYNGLVLNYDFGNRATFDPTSNEFKFSDDLSNSNWVRLNSVIVQEYNGRPKGFETNATALIRSSTAEAQLVRQVFQTPSGVPVNISCYAKSIAGGNLCINYRAGTVLFDFTTATGSVIEQYSYNGSNTSPIPSSITMEDVGDGWYRCSFTGYADNAFSQCQLQPWIQGMTTWSDRYDGGDGEQGVAIIGTQFAEGVTTPQRYFKTAGTSITAPTTVKNLSSSSYTGALNGPTFNTDGSFQFDGTDDDIFTGLNWTPANQFSFTMWFNLDTIKEWHNLVDMYNTNSNRNFQLFVEGDGDFRIFWGDTSGTSAITGTVANEWYFGAFTCNGETGDLYRYGNGTTDTVSATAAAGAYSVRPLRLGRRGDSDANGFVEGKIGEFLFYNRELTAAEVLQNYNATRGKYGV